MHFTLFLTHDVCYFMASLVNLAHVLTNSIPMTLASVRQHFQTSSLKPTGQVKVRTGAKIRNRYNEVPHLTQIS